MRHSSRRPVASGIALLAFLLAGEPVWAGHAAQPHSTQDTRRTSVVPDIILSGQTRESRAVEARLAAFVRAVRRRDGARAARFLSRETAPIVRAAVMQREWPWRAGPRDLG